MNNKPTYISKDGLEKLRAELEDMITVKRPEVADRVLELPRLKLPHPRMWQRAFVLRPLAEIEPGLVPPGALEAVSGQQITRCEN